MIYSSPREHWEAIARRFKAEGGDKYMAGQEEHGGRLWEKHILDLIRNAKEEAMDQYIYLDTLEEQIIGMLDDMQVA